MAICQNCQSWFDDQGDDWKTLCLSCWKRAKRREQGDGGLVDYWRERALTAENRLLQIEHQEPKSDLMEHFKELLFFVHPDRNAGDPRATELTKWLLTMRETLKA